MGHAPKRSGTHLGGKIRLLLQVMDGGKRVWKSRRAAESWMELGGKKKVMEAVEDYLENCANMKVDVEVLERLVEPENREIFLRYILKYSTRGRQQYFPALRHIRETGPLRGKQKKMVGESREHTVHSEESWQNEWHDIEHHAVMAKAPPCPERTLKTPLPKQGSPSSRDEEDHWVAMEDKRRRSIAFEKMAKRMLKYLEDSDDVKVGITELQERLEISEK